MAAALILAPAVGVTTAASGTASSTPATAAMTTACGEVIAVLRDAVVTVPISGGKVDKERAGLVKLVDDATALVAVGKTADALVKLANLRTKVAQLAAAGRVGPEFAAPLTSDIDAASECLSAV